MAREGKIRILAAGTAEEMEVLKERCPAGAVEEKLAQGWGSGRLDRRAGAIVRGPALFVP